VGTDVLKAVMPYSFRLTAPGPPARS